MCSKLLTPQTKTSKDQFNNPSCSRTLYFVSYNLVSLARYLYHTRIKVIRSKWSVFALNHIFTYIFRIVSDFLFILDINVQ